MTRRAVVGLLLLAGACAGTVRIGQADIIASWHGEPLESVVAQWGSPAGEEIAGGRRELVWRRGTPPKPGFHPAIVFAKDPQGGPAVMAQLDNWCERRLWLDARGRVGGGGFAGPACPVYERADRARLTNLRRLPAS